MILLQIRRQARLRREFLYRKGVEERQRAIQEKKDRLKRALDGEFITLYFAKNLKYQLRKITVSTTIFTR